MTAHLKVETDNFGTRCIYRGGCKYYLTPDGRVMRLHFTHSYDREGRAWQTPHHRAIRGKFAEAVRKTLQGAAS